MCLDSFKFAFLSPSNRETVIKKKGPSKPRFNATLHFYHRLIVNKDDAGGQDAFLQPCCELFRCLALRRKCPLADHAVHSV